MSSKAWALVRDDKPHDFILTVDQVGIFLKQLRGQADEAQLLDILGRGGGGGVSLGADKLRALQALLPTPESATALETALLEREPGQLAPPEAFLARILRLPE